jgi:hypothetical protein
VASTYWIFVIRVGVLGSMSSSWLPVRSVKRIGLPAKAAYWLCAGALAIGSVAVHRASHGAK